MFIKKILAIIILIGIGGIIAGIVFLFIISATLPQLPDTLDRLVNTPPTIIYDSECRVLLTLGGRDTVTLDQISPYFQQAIISAEDKNFYYHNGIDKVAIVRSIVRGLFSSRRIAGGSTITQQLAKNLFFTFKRDIIRKIKEALIAIQIEAVFSKEEILEAYCNQIAFGSRANGIERAARTYFGVSAEDLTLAQATLLAGLPNSPSKLNPYSHPENARKRQMHILALMEENNIISSEERMQAEAERLEYRPLDYTGRGTWFADRVIEQCEAKFGKDAVYFGGLKIFTTLKPELQTIAESAVKSGVENLSERLNSDSLQAALIAISPYSGAVIAHIGGVDYRYSQWDRAVDAHRRPGSGFKPLVYFTALDKFEYTPISVVLDTPVTIQLKGTKDWKVHNFGEIYYGDVILKFALAKSLNSVAAQLVNDIGAEEVIETAKNFGIKSDLNPNLSIALGTSGVSMLDMVSCYSVIASGGEYYEPYFIERVESAKGEVLFEHFISGRRVADPESIYLLLDMMKEVLDGGTAVSARKRGFTLPAAGKTGTTDDYIDSWFTGFTPNICVCVWMGFDREKPMMLNHKTGVTGASGALTIWTDFMLKATEGEPPRDFIIPERIKFASVDIHYGYAKEGEGTMTVALRWETEVPQKPPQLSDTTAVSNAGEPQ